MAPVFGISNASEMRNELVMQAGAQGYVVDEVNHSRGNLQVSMDSSNWIVKA